MSKRQANGAQPSPTTAQIRANHASAWSAPYRDEKLREFDLWLEEHDRSVASRALKVAAIGIRTIPNLGPALAGRWLERRAEGGES